MATKNCCFVGIWVFVAIAAGSFQSFSAPLSPPRTIWAVDIYRLSHSEQTLVVTLQGLVARTGEVIWCRTPGMNTILLDELKSEGAEIHFVKSAWQLVDQFREHIRGFIVFDLEDDSINVATSLCGPMGAIAVDSSLVERAIDNGLSQLHDGRQGSEWECFNKYRRRFARNVVVVQNERKNYQLRDWAVYRNAFCFYGLPEDQRRSVLNEVGALPIAYGWEGEKDFVRSASEAGGMVAPADFSLNLAPLSLLKVEVPMPPRRSPEPVKMGERIVAFVLSDGDNLQFMGGRCPTSKEYWASPRRGEFNMTWELPPLFSEIALEFFDITTGMPLLERAWTASWPGAVVRPMHFRTTSQIGRNSLDEQIN